MDSLPQELIEAIIDILPRPNLPSSSLIAKRWRMRSQQRMFDSIIFRAQDEVDRWYSDTQKGQNAIPSCIRSAEFRNVVSWDEPALFGRVLKSFCSLETLSVSISAIPDELPGQILRGEFSSGITSLSLRFPLCQLSTITSMILALPDLKKLTVTLTEARSEQPLPTAPIASQRGPLDLLELYFYTDGVAEALIQAQFTSRYISLGGAISSVDRLLAISSKILVSLTLDDSLTKLTRAPAPLIDPPSFPALTSIRIRLYEGGPSHRIVGVLSFISSTPALASVDLQRAYSNFDKPIPSSTWDDLDRWLARVAGPTAVERDLVLTLRRWSSSESYWEGLLPKFKRAGGEIKTHPNGWIPYD